MARVTISIRSGFAGPKPASASSFFARPLLSAPLP